MYEHVGLGFNRAVLNLVTELVQHLVALRLVRIRVWVRVRVVVRVRAQV